MIIRPNLPPTAPTIGDTMTNKEAVLQAREWARLCERAAGFDAVGQYGRADAITETADEIYQRLTRAGYTAEDLLTSNK